MRISIVLAIAAISVAVASALPTPAAATEQSEAAALCKRNPKCSVIDRGGGNVDLDVAGGGLVTCPPKGACQVLQHGPGYGPARTNGTGGNTITTVKGANPISVISGAPAKTPPKTTTRVTRDHRGDTTVAHPVTFAGTRNGKDPGWGNYGPKKGTGDVIVRDHRH